MKRSFVSTLALMAAVTMLTDTELTGSAAPVERQANFLAVSDGAMIVTGAERAYRQLRDVEFLLKNNAAQGGDLSVIATSKK